MRALVTAAALLALSAAPAAAQCAQEQLAGDWSLVGSNNGQWVHCTVAVDTAPPDFLALGTVTREAKNVQRC